MKRFPLLLALLFGGFLMLGADGCSSDPNVEGAKLDLRNRDFDRALENLQVALEKNPENAEAYDLKGQVLQEKASETTEVEAHSELVDQMMEAYNQAISIDPSLAEGINQRLRLAYFNEFQRGMQAFNRGKDNADEYGTAATYFGNATAILPDSANAHMNMAFSLMNAGRSADAVAPLEKALELGEDGQDTYIFLADLYRANDRSADAVTVLETAREMYPEDENIQAQLLNAYQVAGQMDRAMEVYKETVENDPTNKLYRYNYGSILLQADEFEAAREQLQAAVDIDGEYAVAHYNLGVAYVNEAVAVNQEISDLDDELRSKRSQLSQAEQDRMDQQLSDLDEKRRNLFREAIPHLERARELLEAEGEDVQDICFALFQSYAQTGDTESAKAISECAGVDVN
jgi:tetratricopeptide (TPR) repeat protein